MVSNTEIQSYFWLCFKKKSRVCVSYKIDEDVHDSSEVSDDSCGGEEQAIGHDLQVELNAHENHKHVLPDLK